MAYGTAYPPSKPVKAAKKKAKPKPVSKKKK